MTAARPSDKDDTKSWQRLVWPGVLVALVPAIGYYLAYSYESGIAKAYGYPTDLINLQPTSIFTAAGALPAVLLWTWIVAEAVNLQWPRPWGSLSYYFAPPLVLFAAAAALVVIYGSHWQSWIWLAGLAVVAGLLALLFPLVYQRQHRGLRNKVAAHAAQLKGENTRYLALTLFEGGRGPLAFFVLVVVVFVLLAFALGDASALNRRDYLVMDDGKNQDALLRVYGQQAIFAPIDRQHHTLKQSVIVVQLGTGKSLKLTWEQIGPLNLEASYQHR